MDDLFKAFESDLQNLNPRVKREALTIAKQLVIAEGCEPAAALQEGIRKAEMLFLDEEG